MKTLAYKGIEFDDFKLYREADNSAECEYGYPDEKLNLKHWEEVDVYICPHCIKKYELYEEAQTYKELVEKYLTGEYDDGKYSMICGVKGCDNGNSFDSILSIDKCILKD